MAVLSVTDTGTIGCDAWVGLAERAGPAGVARVAMWSEATRRTVATVRVIEIEANLLSFVACSSRCGKQIIFMLKLGQAFVHSSTDGPAAELREDRPTGTRNRASESVALLH